MTPIGPVTHDIMKRYRNIDFDSKRNNMRTLVAILLLHLLLLLATQFTLWPEMVVYPYLVNNGFQLYRDIINPYLPFLTLALAAFTKIFGTNPLGFRVLTYSLIIVVDFLIYFISKKIYKSQKTAAINLSFFVIFSLPFGINGLWFELIQTPLILLSLYFFNRSRIVLSSSMLTAAILIKQQAIWLLPFFYLLLCVKGKNNSKRIKNILTFSAPILLGVALTLLVVFSLSIQNEFYKWAIILPFFKAGSMPGYVQLATLRQLIFTASLFIVFAPLYIKSQYTIKYYLTASLLMVLFVYPRFDYFHLIPALSTLSLVFASTLSFKNLKRAAFVFLLPLLIFELRYLQGNLNKPVRFFENDIETAAQNLKNLTGITDTIYLQNAPDQLMPLSGRLPPKPWADEFPWYLEYSDTQDLVLNAIKNQKPKFVVYLSYIEGTTYSQGAYKPKEIANYLDQSYENFQQLSNNIWLKKLKTSQ